MDLGYLKIRIDIKTEYDEYKKKYNYKKKELKKEEIKKLFDDFKEFFKRDGSFKFKENEHSIVAEYKEHGIKLDMDVYKNIESEDYNMIGTIDTFENEVIEFVVVGVCNQDHTLQPAFANEDEHMIHDTRYYKDFLDGDISYTFIYKIKGRNEEYKNMQELMLAL
jgi:uncharacterized DUF497 family protein